MIDVPTNIFFIEHVLLTVKKLFKHLLKRMSYKEDSEESSTCPLIN